MIHIGEIIEQELKNQERTPSWLAKKLYCDRSNVYKLLKKNSLDCELLLRISNILKCNFFIPYNDQVNQKEIDPSPKE